MEEEAEPLREASLKSERRRGFRHGLNSALAILIVLATVWVIYRGFFHVPPFAAIFAQVKVPMPTVTLLVFKYSGIAGIILGILCSACILATFFWGDRRESLILNIAGLATVVVCLALQTTAMFLPFVSLLEGIGGP